MNTRTKLAIVTVLLLIPIAVYGYCRYLVYAEIAQAKKVEAEELTASGARHPRGSAERVRNMSEKERREYFKSMMQKQQQKLQQELADYFALPQGKRTAYLDRKIAESAKRRKATAAKSGNRERGKRPTGRDAQGRRETRGGDRKERTPEQRESRRDEMKRRMLDKTTPQFRAQISEYRRAMNERREQRGLPPVSRRRHYDKVTRHQVSNFELTVPETTLV